MKATPIQPLNPAALDVVVYPAPILKKRAQDVAQFNDWLACGVDRMTQLMVEHKGVGLAAPQVGLPLRLFVMSPSGKAEEAQVVINPIISAESGQEEMEEGCLSLPDIRAKIVRYTHLHLDAHDLRGRAISLDFDEYPARIVQHETKLANRKKVKDLEAAAKPKK